MESNTVGAHKGSSYASDEDGVCKDSDAGCDLIKVTVADEPPTPDMAERSFAPDVLDGFIFQIWESRGRQLEVKVFLVDWLAKFPDFEALVKACSDQGLVNAWPTNMYDRDQFGLRAKGAEPVVLWTFQFTPKGIDRMKLKALDLLKEQRQARRQITVDGKHVDLRNERAHMILTPPIENLLPLADIWLKELESETDPRAKRAIGLTLKRLQAYRGHELPLELKHRILRALCASSEVEVHG
jgi:hypothetical protein